MLGSEEEYGGLVQLDLQDAAVLTATGQNQTGWSLLSLSAQSPPADAIAAILDIAVNSAGSAANDTYMEVAQPGIIIAGKIQHIPTGHINDKKGSRLVIVELSDDDKFAYQIVVNAADFDYLIKLVGWILDPSVTRVSMPSEDLSCTMFINQ